MPYRSAWLAPLLALIGLVAFPTVAAADVGPKPELTVRVTYQGGPVPDPKFQAQLLTCAEPGARPFRSERQLPGLDRLDLRDASGCVWQGPSHPVSGGDCEQGQCHFGYMLPSRLRLAVYLPSQGRLYVTDAAERSGMHARLVADLNADGTGRLQPEAVPFYDRDWSAGDVVAALALTIVVELGVVLAYVRWTKRPRRRLLLTCLLGNVLTLPFVWLFAALLYAVGGSAAGLVGLALAELGAWLAEALLYLWVGRLPASRAFLLSLVANCASFLVGVVVL